MLQVQAVAASKHPVLTACIRYLKGMHYLNRFPAIIEKAAAFAFLYASGQTIDRPNSEGRLCAQAHLEVQAEEGLVGEEAVAAGR